MVFVYLHVTLSVMTSALEPRLGAITGLVATQARVAPLSPTAGLSSRYDIAVRDELNHVWKQRLIVMGHINIGYGHNVGNFTVIGVR